MPTDDDEVTPRRLYMSRRTLMRGGILAATAAGTGWLYRKLNDPSSGGAQTARLDALVAAPAGAGSGFVVTGEEQTDFQSATHYNNFYEFTTDKDAVAAEGCGNFKTAGWKVAVDGLCAKSPTHVRPWTRPASKVSGARGAGLPDAVRRDVVDGDPVGRVLAGEAARPR